MNILRFVVVVQQSSWRLLQRRRRLFVTMASGFFGILALFVFLSVLFPLPSPKPYSLVVEDRNGVLLHAFLAPDGAWRLRTDPAEIPDRLKRILIQREDRWFFWHPGINPFALVRACVQNIRAGRRVSGGSTVTMQIARMLEPKERTVWSKAVEMFRALQLESKYSKNELLEMYLSIVPLGGNIEGIKSASLLYYQTPPERLNIARLFDLILIPRNPNGLQPDRNPDRLLAERLRQSSHWVARGYLSREDSLILLSTPAGVTRSSPPNLAPHYCLRLRERFITGGDVRGSIDLSVQQTVEKLLSSHMHSWSLNGVKNAAVLVVENKTREVLAYAGSAEFADCASQGQVDAVRALRSPGSTLKPLLYAMLMDAGTLTPKSRLLDVPYDAEGFTAENYDGTYSGPVFADDALRRSLNVPMVRLLKNVGTSAFVQFAVNAGVQSLQAQKSKLGLSIILGGCGVTLEELVTSYTAFPRGGLVAPLRFLKGVQGMIAPGDRAFSESAAYMVTHILSGLTRPDLPNGFESSITLPAIAFKTGTSYGRRDAWAIGYTSSHTVGVWLGNVDNTGIPELAGGRAAAPLLVNILNAISRGCEKTILPLPSDVSLRQVCVESGSEPTTRCQQTVEDLYSLSRTQRTPCESCEEYLVSRDGSMSFCPSCLAAHPYRTLTVVTYPPELLEFWKRSNVHFVAVPPHNPLCTSVSSGNGPRIISPSSDMTYYLVSRKQKLSFQAAPLVDVFTHAWYVDDRFLKTVKAGENVLVAVPEGEHTISCVDDKGRVGKVKITIRYLG